MGFIADIVFSKFKISSVILLMFLGFLIGPLLGIVDVSEGEIIKEIYPIVGALAFILILFDAGTKTNVIRLIKTAPKSTAFTIFVFVVTVFSLGFFLKYIAGMNILSGLLLGAIVGGISSPIVISLVDKLPVSAKVKDSLILESTLTDVLCVLTSVLILKIIIGGGTDFAVNSITTFFVSTFSVSIVLGIAAGAIWIFILSKMPKNSFFYMLTLAILFFLYSITEYNGGNGAIAVFVFGLLMGHMEEINALINFDNDRKVDKKFLLFQDEVTFFVRTFFFVYIGLLLSVKYVNFITIYFSLLVLAIAVVARSIGSFIIFKDCDSKEKIILNSMIPRGLAAAVLVTYVGGDVMIMYLEEIVFMVILVTNIFPSLMVYLLDSKFLNIDSSEETEQEI